MSVLSFFLQNHLCLKKSIFKLTLNGIIIEIALQSMLIIIYIRENRTFCGVLSKEKKM